MIHLKNYITKIIYINDFFNDYKSDLRTEIASNPLRQKNKKTNKTAVKIGSISKLQLYPQNHHIFTKLCIPLYHLSVSGQKKRTVCSAFCKSRCFTLLRVEIESSLCSSIGEASSVFNNGGEQWRYPNARSSSSDRSHVARTIQRRSHRRLAVHRRWLRRRQSEAGGRPFGRGWDAS